MSVIDLCSNGVTKSYVRKEINKAVFESGTMTPDSTQQMIDESIENLSRFKRIDLASASEKELVDLFNDFDSYEVVYTYKGKTYQPVAYVKKGNAVGCYWEFIVTDDEYSIYYDTAEYGAYNIYDRIMTVGAVSGRVLTPRFSWRGGITYDWHTMSETQKERLLKRIYDAFDNIPYGESTNARPEAMDFTLRWREDDFEGGETHLLWPEGKMYGYKSTEAYIVSTLTNTNQMRINTLSFTPNVTDKTVTFNTQTVKIVTL